MNGVHHFNGVTDGVSNGTANGGVSDGATTPSKKRRSDGAASASFLRQLLELILKDAVLDGCDRDGKVVEFVHPKELFGLIDLELRESGESDERLLQLCRETIRYSVKSGHPHFFNQLWSGLDTYGLAGAWLTESVNTSQYTFEVAPVFTLMEEVVLRRMRRLVGWDRGDGIFAPGGSIANMYGMNLARYHQFPHVKTDGMHALPRLIVFTSLHSHYSVKKGAALLGIGVGNVWSVECDERGRMIPAELEKRVREAKDKGYHPFLVNATSGTTVVGAFDPLDAIADVCEKFALWLHVDACWGGGALLSPKLAHLLRGIERSDSVAWDPHKMMGTPLQCVVFLTKHENLLSQCNSAHARYLFQQDKFYDVSYDTGDKSLQCGRKVDVFKLWLMWKARGDAGFKTRVENAVANAQYLAKRIRETDGFELLYDQPEYTNVCFWYIPPRMRGEPRTDAWWQQLSKVAPNVKERMVMAGTMLIGYQPLGSFVNFFRFVTTNGDGVTTRDMDFVLQEIARLGEDL